MKKVTSVNQQISPVRAKKTNRTKLNGLLPDINSRDFGNRMQPRYEAIPPMPANLPEPSFSESSQKILKERYLLKGGDLQVVETIGERFWHVAYDIASAEFDFGATQEEVMAKARSFYQMMVWQQFEPNSPTLMNAGKRNGLQYSACFVLPVEDSLSGIFDSIKAAALIHQTGGGTGFAFSRLRGKGSRVKTTGGVASGPVSFLKVFNSATESIKQGGTRRGANMGILRVDHPDVLDFIRCKAELDDQNAPIYDGVAPLLPDDEMRTYFKQLMLDRQISNFNISVAITDKFMEAYFKNESFDLVDPGGDKAVVGQLKAREVFDEIIDRAWHTGDPGVVFIDRINNSTSNPMQGVEVIEATNPCGEQPLAAWDACNLGSINLGKFVRDDGKEMDWDGLKRVTSGAVNFLDNVVQTNPYTLEPIYDVVHRNRRIGLGVMGFADMLFKLKIPYGSEAALEMAEQVMKFINEEGHRESERLAAIRGVFPNWPQSIYGDKATLSSEARRDLERKFGPLHKNSKPLRNSTVTTIAPTGTISIIGDCSSGIEPVFALAYLHKAKGAGDQMRTLTIANQTFEEIAKKEGFYTDDLATKVMDHGTVAGIEEVPAEWQQVFQTAQEIHPDWHVKMQAAFQKYTDNGVSKTINMPNEATREDIARAYLMAWETGCNGITVYRDGSKVAQVLNISNRLKPKAEAVNETGQVVKEVKPQQARPMVLRGRTYKIMTPVGEGFVTVNRDENEFPFEVFVTVGKGGMHTMADAEALGRLISMNLRMARPGERKEAARKIAQHLRGIGGSSHIGFGKDRVMSLADAVGKVLSEELDLVDSVAEGELMPLNLTVEAGRDDVALPEQVPALVEMAEMTPAKPTHKQQADLCPECGVASFVREDGCEKCYSCGYSKC